MCDVSCFERNCIPLFVDSYYCGGLWLCGSNAARALGQVSLSRMFEGEGSIPVRDIGFSPLLLILIPISGQAVGGISPGTPVCSPSLGYLQNKNLILNYVIAELTKRTTWL